MALVLGAQRRPGSLIVTSFSKAPTRGAPVEDTRHSQSGGAEGGNNGRPLIDPNLWLPVAFVLAWSSGLIVAKDGLRYAGPFHFLAWRAVLACLLLWTICFASGVRTRGTLGLGRNIGTAVLAQIGYQSTFVLALDHSVTPGRLAIILALQPILTGIVELRSTTWRTWTGLVFGFGGVAVTIGSIGEGGAAVGAVWALAALLSLTAGTLVQHRWNGTGNLLHDMAIQYSASAVSFVALASVAGGRAVDWTWPFVFSLAWMVLVLSIGATLVLYLMLRRGNVLNVSALFYCIPPITGLLDYAVYGDRLSALQCGGMGLVVFGLAMVLMPKSGRSRGV